MTKTILIVAANPSDEARLRFDREIKEIDGVCNEQFKVKPSLATRWTDLMDELLRYEPHIVHFVGHGKGKLGLILEDDAGNGQPVTGNRLLELFKQFKQVECVVLNACETEELAEEIYQQVSCVIGMSQSIGDRYAKSFAVGFYKGVAAGKSYHWAFDFGKTAIESEWHRLQPIIFPPQSNQQNKTTQDDKDLDWLNQITVEIDSRKSVENKSASEATEFRHITDRWNQDLYKLDHKTAKKGTSKILEKIKDSRSGSPLFLFQKNDAFLGKRYIEHLKKSIDSSEIGRFSQPYQVGLQYDTLTEIDFLMNLGEQLAIEFSSSQEISVDRILDKIKVGLKGCNVFFLEVNLPALDGENGFLRWFLQKFWGRLLERMSEFRSQNSSAVFIGIVTLKSGVDKAFSDEFTCKVAKPYPDKFIALPNEKWKVDEIRGWMKIFSVLPLSDNQLEKIPKDIFEISQGMPLASERELLQELEKLAS
ncbi:MAG: CHAT domain-containing protein [Alkalinema sp. CAN_BIN05]|nr:CHAT domain-containing protein [Alkalinema sp. CAN_BIN05]